MDQDTINKTEQSFIQLMKEYQPNPYINNILGGED